jgi:hypothetical protein
VALPLQAPPHPTKDEPFAGVAVSVKVCGEEVVNWTLQVPVEQERPTFGLEVTVPSPTTVTDSVCDRKTAVTSTGSRIVSWQGPVPLQAPPQLEKIELASGVAVSVTVCGSAAVFT